MAMKQLASKYRKPILVVSLMILLFLFSLPPALAGEVRSDEVVHIKPDEVIHEDLYVSGQKILIDGVVKGDVMAAGQSVIVNGTVEEDLLATAQAVTVNGEVGDDLRGGAMVFLVNGVVGDDVTVGGFSFESGPESTIGGDLLMGGFQALIGGELAGDVAGGFGGLKITGQVGGDVDVEVGQPTGGPSPVNFMSYIPDVPPMPSVPMGLTIAEAASVAGNVTYRSPARGKVNESAVAGQVKFTQQVIETDEEGEFDVVGWLWNQIQRLLRLLLVGALLVWLAPAFISGVGQTLREKLWPSLGWGVLTPIIFLAALLVLGLISLVVGFPVVVFGTVIFGYLLILFYLGAIVVGQGLGYWLLRRIRPERAESVTWTTLTGLVVVWLLTAIPYLGVLFGLLVVFFGAGSLWLAGRELMQGSDSDDSEVEAAAAA